MEVLAQPGPGGEAGTAITKTPDIQVPSVPRHLEITQTMWEDLLWNPVMAAKIIMGVEFDWFQQARLRFLWFIQEYEDHSGFSTGKTLVDFVCAQLRAILIPQQALGVYYPSFETGKNAFWKYYSIIRARLFHAQIGKVDNEADKEKEGKTEGAGAFKAHYRNGNTLLMPAPSFMKKAATSASLRFNWMLIEEWTHIDASSTGIDDQLVQRCTAPSWNQHHPLWGNRIIYTAPAKTRMHPGYERHEAFERSKLSGNPRTHTIGFCYKDYSNKKALSGKTYRQEYRIDNTINAGKKKMGKVDWMGEGLGIWAASGKGWFTEDMIENCMAFGKSRNVTPLTSRSEAELILKDRGDGVLMPGRPPVRWQDYVYFFLGVDPAPSEGQRSDDGALVVGMATPKRLPDLVKGQPAPLSNNEADWYFDYIFARRLTWKQKASSPQWSGVIHRLHQNFRFEKIVMDPNGGGTFLKRDMIKPKQLIQGHEVITVPIGCGDEDAKPPHMHVILHMAKRGDAGIEKLWPNLAHDGVFNDTMFSEMKTALEATTPAWPMKISDWRYEKQLEYARWSVERQWAIKNLDAMRRQYSNVKVATDDKGMELWARGARQFGSVGKKDLVSAGIYAYTGFRIWLIEDGFQSSYKPENKVAFGGNQVGTATGRGAMAKLGG